MSKLVEGKIPAHTDCPFRTRCPFDEDNTCRQRGVDHNVDFSCASARAYDLIESARSPNKMRGAFA